MLTILAASLYHHNQAPLRTGDQILVGVSDFTVDCAWTQHNDHGAVQMVAAGLEVHSPGREITLREAVAGAGDTVDAAIAQAVSVWQHGQFEAITEAFADPPAAPHATVVLDDQWAGQRLGWDVYTSGLQISALAESTLVPALTDQPFLLRLADALTAVLDSDPPTIHWIKLYGGQPTPGSVEIDCWFDNYEWAEALVVLKALPWPSIPGYISVRQFLILKPARAMAEPTLRLTRSTPPARVLLQAAQLLYDHPTAEDEDLVAALVAQGVREQEAEKLVVFLPIAAGRRVLQGLTTLPPVFMVHDAAGSWVEFPYETDPIYQAAQRLLTNGYAGKGLSREMFRTLVQRSVELQLINEELNAGHDVSGEVMSPLTLLRLTAADFGLPPAPDRDQPPVRDHR